MEKREDAKYLLERLASDVERGELVHVDVYRAIIKEATDKFGDEFTRPYRTQLERLFNDNIEIDRFLN